MKMSHDEHFSTSPWCNATKSNKRSDFEHSGHGNPRFCSTLSTICSLVTILPRQGGKIQDAKNTISGVSAHQVPFLYVDPNGQNSLVEQMIF